MPNHAATHKSRDIEPEKAAGPSKIEAREAAKLLRTALQNASGTESMLNQSRASGSTGVMRGGADTAELNLSRIIAARDSLNVSLGKRVPVPMQELLDRAELAEIQLRADIARIRLEADDIDRAQSKVGQVAHGEVQTSPEAIRKQATENVPPGICDDALMQGTRMCPLDVSMRESNRALAERTLGQIGSAWGAAIGFAYTDAQVKAAMAKIGAVPLRDMLLNIAFGFAGGAIAGALASKMTGSYAARAAFRQSVVSMEQFKQTVSAVGKKGGEAAAKQLPAPAAPDNAGALLVGLKQLQIDWENDVVSAVRYLPDAALTAFAAALKTSKYDVSYFKGRIETLMKRFGQLDKTMGKSGWAAAQTTTVWVVHPKGGGRMALAREEEVDDTFGRGKASETSSKRTGRLIFLSWVDRSLESVALDIGRQRHLVTTTALTTSDSRWVDPGSPALAEWHGNSAARDDVTMFNGGK